jgi:hypothetical protein
VLSVNLLLATAQAVVPRLVPHEDLLMANSMATVGGTVALLLGVFVGGWIADLMDDNTLVIAIAGGEWLVASLVATRIRSPLLPHHVPEAPVRDELGRAAREFADGITRLARTPRALGPITSITLDQVGQGMVLVLSLFVFRDRFEEGVGSFSNLIGAGGLGVLLGILTVGKLEERLPKERIVARAFFFGGLVLIAVSTYVTGWSVLVASFAVGLTFAWKKIPVDTMVQEAIPDGYRGRVFAVYDVAYNLCVAAAFLAPRRHAPRHAAATVGGFICGPHASWTGDPELAPVLRGARAEEDPRPSCGEASRRRSKSSAARWRRPMGCAGRASACGCWTGRRSRSPRSSPTALGTSSASSTERERPAGSVAVEPNDQRARW